MDFLALRTRTAELSGLDVNDGATDTRLKAWINEAYKDVSAFFDWPWLLKQAIIQTQPDITTGTVSVTNGSTALTFSSAPSSTLGSLATVWAISIEGSDDFYFFNAHTAGSASATLSNSYLGTTGGTKTYTLRKLYYSLPSDLDRMLDIRSTVDGHQLRELDPLTLDRFVPTPSSGNNVPNNYFFFGYDSDKNWQIGFESSPGLSVNLIVRYYQKITDLSLDTDAPLVPVKYHNAIIYGSISLYGYMFTDDTRVNESDRKFKEIMNDMVRNARPGKERLTIIQPWDQRVALRPSRPRLPDNYGYIS